MPKYMVQASYVGEGLKGLLKEGGTKRREEVAQVIEGMGGKLESFYYENIWYYLRSEFLPQSWPQ
jgi:uncharacterized protein with GYD domain